MIAWDGTELSYNHSCFSMVRVIVCNIILYPEVLNAVYLDVWLQYE